MEIRLGFCALCRETVSMKGHFLARHSGLELSWPQIVAGCLGMEPIKLYQLYPIIEESFPILVALYPNWKAKVRQTLRKLWDRKAEHYSVYGYRNPDGWCIELTERA